MRARVPGERARLALLLGLAGLSAIPEPAFAAGGKPKVLILDYQLLDDNLQDDLGQQTTVVVAKELGAGELTVVRAESVGGAEPRPQKPGKPADAPTGDPAAGAKAEEQLSRAREALEDSEFDKAAKLLEKVVKLLEDNADALPDLRLLPEAYLQAGVACFRDGREDEGDDFLNKAVHLAPERKLDPADYPPIFIRVYDRARYNVLRRPRGRLEVKAAPGTTVFFDGRNLGKTPLALEEALPGQHWVRVERPGEPVLVRRVELKSKQTTVVDFGGGGEAEAAPVVGASAAIAANRLEDVHLAQLKAAGAKAGADLVMFGAIYKTDTAYQVRSALLSVKDGSVGRLTSIAFDLDMLTAEIEVYKLADDARAQIAAGKPLAPVSDRPLQLAPEHTKTAKKRNIVAKAKEARLTTVVAAPAPIKPPASVYADGERAPLAAAGAAPAVEGAGAGAVVKPGPSLVPKDELVPGAVSAVPTAPPSARESAAPAAAVAVGVVPKDEAGEDDEPTTWWIWVLLGAVAVGAAGTGGYLAVTGGTPDEGKLRISW
jgi:hypothetical protein